MCSPLSYQPHCGLKPFSFSFCLQGKQKLLLTFPYKYCDSSWTVRSASGKKKSSINDIDATDPSRVLLERLFTQTQKLEKMSSDSVNPSDSQFEFQLGTLETDLQAVLSALKKKEEDLENAEKRVLFEQNKINLAKEELARREQEIASASFKQKKLEKDLELANIEHASQSSEIDDLKVQIEEREREICNAYSKLALKEDVINMLQSELSSKSALVFATEFDLKEKSGLLNEVSEIVKKQEVEIQQLRKAVQEREDDLKVSASLRELKEEKLKAVEIKLEKRTTEWLIAQDELKKLAVEADKRTVEVNKSAEGFRKVKKLLSDVRSELHLSQKALCSSRQKMEDRGLLLEKQFIELEEEKKSLLSYMTNLENAQVELESERVVLRVAEARNGELERALSTEKELITQLQSELKREKSSLEREIREKSVLQEKLDQESTKLEEAQNLLQDKESDLVEARLEIEKLKSERDSLNIILEERDIELYDAKIKLEDVSKEIIELKTLMSSREDQLMQTENMLKEKDEHVQTMQLELNDNKLRSSEAETVVKKFLELTRQLVNSVDDDNPVLTNPLLTNFAGEPKWEKKHLENELEIARESLRTKDIEVVSAQRSLSMKEEELKRVQDRLEQREREIKETNDGITQDANDLRQLYSLAAARIGERSMSDLVTEKLQIEAAQLESEAATTALYKLTEMSRELLAKSSLTSDNYLNFEGNHLNSSDLGRCEVDNECLKKFKTEVYRLSTLSEQFVKEAGIVDDVHQQR